MANMVIGAPIFSDVGVLETPAFDASGDWRSTLPLTNLQDRRLWRVARSRSADPAVTRVGLDLGRDRQVRAAAVVRHNLMQKPRALVDWKIGDALPEGYVFARASVARYIDENGVLQSAASGAIRDGHYHDGKRGMLLEEASDNLCLQSSNFGTTWAAVGTPTRAAAAHTASGVTLDLIGDDDAGALEHYSQTIAFTGDAVKAISLHVKQGTSTSSVIHLRDVTAGVNRLLGVLTWAGGLPVVTMTNGTYFGYVAMADGVFRLLFASTAVTAANTNSVRVYPAGVDIVTVTGTGDLYAGGVQAENLLFPTSYIPTTTTTASRVADSLYLPFAHVPSPMRAEVEQVNIGNFIAAGITRRFLHIGAANPGTDPRFGCTGVTTGAPQTIHDNGVASKTSTMTAIPAFGAVVRTTHTVTSRGIAGVSGLYDGAAAGSGEVTEETALGTAWAAERLYLAGLTNENGISLLRSVRVFTAPSTNAKWRVTGTPDAALFSYRAGDDIAARGGVFSRASEATYIDRLSILRTAATGVPRDDHWVGGERSLLMEPAATQLVANPQTPSGFTDFGTPVIVTGQRDPWGGSTAIRIEDNDAVNREGKQASVTFTGDGTKSACFAVRPGSVSILVLAVRDVTAGNVDRHAINVVWSSPTSAPTVTTSVGAGLIFTPRLVLDTQGNSWWLISFTADSVVAANTNVLFAVVGTTGATVGTFFLAGINAWNSTLPFSWQATAATRAADSLYFPFAPTPQTMTGYVRVRECGGFTNDGNNKKVLHIGSSNTTTDPRFAMGIGSAGLPFGQYDDGVTDVSSQISFVPTPVFGDAVELRTALRSDWTVIEGSSVNAATERIATASAASASAAAWASPRLYLSGGLTSNNACYAYTHITFVTGEQTTMALMRAATYDSGWLDAWPAGLNAETVDGAHAMLLHVLPTTAPACASWGVQFHDPDNADRYVEAGRLVLAGGFQPSANPVPGATFSAESATARIETDGGSAQFDEKPQRRVFRCRIENLPESEAWLSAWRTMRKLGPAGQCLVIPDPDASADYMSENAFLAVPKELSALEFGSTTVRSPTFAFTEEVG